MRLCDNGYLGLMVGCSLSGWAVLGCGSNVRVGSNDGDGGLADATVTIDGALADDGGTGTPSDGGAPDDGSQGPYVHIHVRAVATPVAHAPTTAGQTPRDYSSGYRSFSMLRGMDDPSPLVVFDYGDDYIEAGYDDGDDTVVASVPARDLSRGAFTVGRTVLTHVRYTVDATLHYGSLQIPGMFHNIVVISDRTEIESVARDRGFYRFVFDGAGTPVMQEGAGLSVPTFAGGGFEVRVEEGETAYYYPLDIVVDPDIDRDVHMIMEVNMHESFRWEDQDMPDYGPGVFDVTPAGYEPLRQFGANSYRVYMEPAL